MMKFPEYRARRLRRTEAIRRMVTETTLSPDDLVLPLFVREGKGERKEINAMPGVTQLTVDLLVEECKDIHVAGVPAVILFGIPSKKDEFGSSAYDPDGVVQRAIRALKDAVPQLVVMTDVCLCEYTDHGHCGVIKDGDLDNDATLELLARMALSHASAGADIVAPSDMMDGRISAIRKALDSEGYQNVAIMSYSAKYASCFYGPFREAAESSPRFGDRRSYQMDPPNIREAIREVTLDIQEGADIIMVKPALAYLDVIRAVRERFNHPISAYNVSGEYSMVKASVEKGWLDERRAVLEILTSIKRAGADLILTYWAKDVALWLGS